MTGRGPSLAVSVCLVLFVLSQVVLVPAGAWTRRAAEGTVPQTKHQQQQMLVKMLDAVELGLAFFSQDYSTINLDGLFGMRIGQGQIMHAVKECKDSRSCPEAVQRRLEKIHDGIQTAATAAMSYVKESDPKYFERFITTINSSYLLQYKPVTLTDLHLAPIGSDPSYDEEKGDMCLSRLMGTMVEETKQKVKVCNVTQNCIDMMTAAGRSEYSITHQLLYFIFAEKNHCIEETEKILRQKTSEMEHRLCASIYKEAAKEVQNGKVDQLKQDLFLEQVLLCGIIGVENFFRPDWMKMALSWQKPVGCFSLDSPELLLIEERLSHYQQQERALMMELKEEAKMIKEQHGGLHTSGTGRKLLREIVMADGCLSHKTGLGFGTLCLFTRYLVRQNYLQD